MSLERYRRPRLVVLRPTATAYEAARAMADNHIGAILVSHEQQLVGLVTDRDLALDVIAGDLDPHATTVREVMSDEVDVVDLSASVEDAVRVMIERACRRVPVVEDGRPVGMVTLDDLLLEGDIDQAAAAAVIAAQLEVGARFKAEGVPHPTEPAQPGMADGRRRARRRSEARAEGTYRRLLRQVEERAGLGSKDRSKDKAETALRIVLGALLRRLMPDEARQLIAQLPSRMHAELEREAVGPDRSVTTVLIQTDLADRLGFAPERAAEVLSAVLEVVSASVSAGEVDDVRAQLPAAMKDLFPAASLRKAG